MPVNFLGPGLLLRAAEYPAFHVLGFDDEHAVSRNYDMVDLRGAVLGRKGHVFEQGIDLLIEK